MKKSKKEQKKARKEEKQVRSTVIEAFAGRNTENADKLQKANRKNKKIDNVLIQSLTQSVLLNKSMIKRDRNQTKKWQESYYQHLFTEFKTFIDKYNEGLQVKGDKLSTRVNDLKITKRNLQNEIDKLELKKKVLANV